MEYNLKIQQIIYTSPDLFRLRFPLSALVFSEDTAMMTSPFDTKNRFASALDRFALGALALLCCIVYFASLWHSAAASALAGTALFALIALGMLQLERHTLHHRDRILRERVGGMIAIEELILMPASRAAKEVCVLLCTVLGAEQLEGSAMQYESGRWLVRCAQCMQGSRASEGDVLAAHRARIESGSDKCVLASTAGFSPGAVRAAEWLDPPVRLITGRQLAALFGRQHPASDEEIAAHAARRRKPFTRERILSLALSPVKQKRYLLCAFLLLVFYLTSPSYPALSACLLSFLLALACGHRQRKHFRL